jgi:TRAP-type C4-dicarboxylate transport system substrate-binding protein
MFSIADPNRSSYGIPKEGKMHVKRRENKISGRLGCFIFSLLVLLLASGPALAADKPIILKGATMMPKTHVFMTMVQPFIDMVAKDSKGRIKIIWIGGPEVIKPFDKAEAVKRGTIDIDLFNSFGYYRSLMPVGLAKGLSTCSPSEERANGLYEMWDKNFQKYGNVKYLGQMNTSVQFYLYSVKKIKTLEDMKGMTIRTMPLYVPFLKELEISPVNMPPTEVYTALQRGVVDGAIWPTFIKDWGWPELIKYILNPGFFTVEAGAFINLDKWNTIPKDLQDVLLKAAVKIENRCLEVFPKLIEKEMAVWKKAGMQFTSLPAEDTRKFIDTANEVTWNEVIRQAPEDGPKFKELTMQCSN